MIASPYLAMLFVQGWLADLFHEDCRKKVGERRAPITTDTDPYPLKPEMRNSLKKESASWRKSHGVRRSKLNAGNASGGIEIEAAWHSHPTTTGYCSVPRSDAERVATSCQMAHNGTQKGPSTGSLILSVYQGTRPTSRSTAIDSLQSCQQPRAERAY